MTIHYRRCREEPPNLDIHGFDTDIRTMYLRLPFVRIHFGLFYFAFSTIDDT